MQVSVIIPALNEADSIQRCTAAARREHPPDAVEIIVADGGSTDGTPDLLPPDVRLVRSPRGRGVQMNRGAAASHGEILVFCHADTLLPEGWRDAAIDALRRPGVSGGTFQTLILPEEGSLILYVRNRVVLPTNWRIMFGDQTHFMSRATFEAVGGYQEILLMEDVEMSRALHRVGKLVRIPLRVITSSRRFLERGALRQSLANAWSMFRYLYLNATAEDIAQTYRSSRELAP